MGSQNVSLTDRIKVTLERLGYVESSLKHKGFSIYFKVGEVGFYYVSNRGDLLHGIDPYTAKRFTKEEVCTLLSQQ